MSSFHTSCPSAYKAVAVCMNVYLHRHTHTHTVEQPFCSLSVLFVWMTHPSLLAAGLWKFTAFHIPQGKKTPSMAENCTTSMYKLKPTFTQMVN